MSNKTQAKKRLEIERATRPADPAPAVTKPARAKRPDEYRILRMDQLHRDPHQPRTKFDEGALMELKESIRAEGLQQPITVTFAYQENGVDYYYIKYGERRYRVHQLLEITTIRCIISGESYDGNLSIDRLLKQSSENCAREAQSHSENIRVVRLTVEDTLNGVGEEKRYGLTQVALKRVADAHGKKLSWAKTYHELSRLHPDLQEMLDCEDGVRLNIQVARSLSSVPHVQQQELLDRAKPYFAKNFHVGLNFISKEARVLRKEAGHKMRGRQSEHKDNFRKFSEKLLRLSTQFQGPVLTNKEWHTYLEGMVHGMSVIECEQMAKTLLQAVIPFGEAYDLLAQKRRVHMEGLRRG